MTEEGGVEGGRIMAGFGVEDVGADRVGQGAGQGEFVVGEFLVELMESAAAKVVVHVVKAVMVALLVMDVVIAVALVATKKRPAMILPSPY